MIHNVGLGDVVKYGLGKLGIKQKPGCPCPKRQAWLNSITPGYRKRVPMYRGRYQDLPVISGGSPGIFFDEDWESATFPPSGWFFAKNNGGTTAVVDAQALSGTHSLQMTYMGSGDDLGAPNDTLISPGGFSTTNGFFRFAIKVMPGFIQGTNGQTKMLLCQWGCTWMVVGGPGNPPAGMRLQLYAWDCDSSGTDLPIVIHLGTTVADGAWHQYELEIQLNTPGVANGAYRVWVDGTLVYQNLDRQIRGPSPGAGAVCNPGYTVLGSENTLLGLQVFRQDGTFSPGSTGTLYLDRVAFGDTRIGVVGGGGDTTPPTIQITGPTSNPTYITRTSPL